MPAQLSFFDMSALTSFSTGYFITFPVALGPNWRPGDIRVICQDWLFQPAIPQCNSVYTNPPGFTFGANPGTTVGTSNPLEWFNVFGWVGMSWRRLVAGDTDTFFVINDPDPTNRANFVFFTVRGVDPAYTVTSLPGAGTGPNASNVVSPAALVSVPSASIPSAGTEVVFIGTGPYPGQATSTGASLGTPTGWTNLVASANSGATYNVDDHSNGCEAFAKSYSTSGSTGTINVPFGGANNPYFSYIKTFFKPAPDVSATAGSATTTSTATSATFSTSTAVTLTTGSATTTATATTAFNPLRGYWISDPLILPGTPVTGSVLRWTSEAPIGSSVMVETSINNGASWDTAFTNRSVPRLIEGDTSTRSVIVRTTLTRTNATDPPPKVLTLEVQVSSDSGVDELCPIGHGMIDKVTTKTVGGTTGSGSSTSVTGSTAVTSRGGGQSGGGASIKVHVTDLSRAIKRNVWQMPYTVPGGMNYGAAAVAMVKDRLPSQTDFSVSSTQTVTPLLVYGMSQGGDPWQDIQDLATAIGFEAFFDPRGVFVFRPVPDPRLGEPVWTFDEDANPLVAEASRELSDEQTFNHVVVMGQSTSAQNAVSAEAFDNDPSSPTYILGPYGEVTTRLTFSLITDQTQAQNTANAILYNSLGAADTVTITCVPMPALEPGDIVKIKVSDVRANGTYMINSMTTSLSPADPQQLVCFRQSTNI